MRRLFECAAITAMAVGALSAWPVAAERTSAARIGPEPASHKPYTETIPNSETKFDMLAIPGGTFLIGSPPQENGRQPDEGPQRAVTIKPFWMGKLEVTWDEYDLFWKDRAGNKEDQRNAEKKGDQKEIDALSRPTPPYADPTFGFGRDRYPALGITHHAAMEYCRWLSEKTGKIYRLPTEAEWEWAARAGTTSAYFFGNDAKKLAEYAWFADNSEEMSHPVGEKKPSPWGLHDIYGNVSEWCLDSYRKDFYATLPSDRPALMPFSPLQPTRFPDVARGGSWADKADKLRSGARRASEKTWIRLDPQRPQSIWWLTSAEFVGFRLVRPVEEMETLKGIRSLVKWESR